MPVASAQALNSATRHAGICAQANQLATVNWHEGISIKGCVRVRYCTIYAIPVKFKSLLGWRYGIVLVLARRWHYAEVGYVGWATRGHKCFSRQA